MWPKWTLTVLTVAAAAWWGRGWDLAWLAGGYALFLWNEYAVHRWMLHAPRGTWRDGARALHMRHHADPSDLDVLFLPWQAVALGIPFAVLVAIVSRDPGATFAFMAGQTAAMMWYESIHYVAHRPGPAPRSAWARALRRHHLAHHHQEPHSRFGIAGRGFDRLLRTGGARPRK